MKIIDLDRANCYLVNTPFADKKVVARQTLAGTDEDGIPFKIVWTTENYEMKEKGSHA